MATTYYYVIQDTKNEEYKTPTGWDINISSAQTFTTPTDCKETIDVLPTGYYVMRYMGNVA
tara:strand:+ start:984 stop:1166 length:183 start_codon:yes stop_codon:yes gene_type:complete